jgi:nucleoside-diphosphate-sugar epimerase
MTFKESSLELISDSDLSLISMLSLNKDIGGKNVLITGATGMIGSYLLESILANVELGLPRPNRILLPVRDHSLSQKNRYSKFEIVLYCDFNDVRMLEEHHVVFHIASPSNSTKYSSYQELENANLRLLDNIDYTKVNKFIYLSSGEVSALEALNSDHKVEFASETRMHYPNAKKVSENYYKTLALKYEFQCLVVRLFHTFGPGMRENDGRSFADFIWSGARGKTIKLHSSGSQSRTFLYTADLVSALSVILSSNKRTATFEVGAIEELTILNFARLVGVKAGVAVESSAKLDADKQINISPFDVAIPNVKELNQLGWRQKMTIDYAIESTLNWAKKQV